MKILMGIDDSKFAEALMHGVVAQFRTENSEILVLHVLEPVEPVAPPEMAQGYAQELEDQKKPAFTFLEQIGDE